MVINLQMNISFFFELKLIINDFLMLRKFVFSFLIIFYGKVLFFIFRYYRGTPKHIVIMSDLTDEGFKMIPRRQGFDKYHSKIVMESIAKLHAASLKVLQEDPSAGIQDMSVFKEEMNTTYVVLYRNALNSMARQISTWKS